MHSPIQLPETWQTLLSQTIESPEALIRYLQLPETILQDAHRASAEFTMRIPRPWLDRIEKGNLDDPLLRQVLPLGEELNEVAGFTQDPLEELHSNPVDGLIHKYKGRVLIILTGACAINCRYCFRRHFPYAENRLGPAQWQNIIDYISADKSITEVIFSGGDPLVSSDARIKQLIADLEQIPHLTRLRIHSRLPVVLPQRVTASLTSILQQTRLNVVTVIHSNHPQELDDQVATAIHHLRQANVTVLNQAVLLRGVNDSSDILAALSEKLFNIGVLPYYLFTFDPVKGAAHFDVPDTEAKQLMRQLQDRLPGYLVPRLAREIPGRGAKTLLFIDQD
ncbi:EF-P beta-lysylation protein EpmB [Amphritea sp. 1_MG-2023]|uniref:EF-P beta-lysylation protein EpmB n=1 Tax=Amphritea sp. 1_MG-2023 TaxID=3062670 RepID=UPI0026E3626D|nr:EF-P beta-lysylation protein EpmB [Amphritea sp. 1_MG-2023]MDO6565036.1 EF-P beta-lysylation protein EpmB [Amphritea sp. 1_MG-2023]